MMSNWITRIQIFTLNYYVIIGNLILLAALFFLFFKDSK